MPQPDHSAPQMMTRSAALRVVSGAQLAAGDTPPAGANKRVTVAFSGGGDVERTDYWTGERWIESLEVSDTAIDAHRLDQGVPFLRDHDARLESVIGTTVPGSYRVEDGAALVDVDLSPTAADADVVAKIEGRIIRSVSVGYTVQAWAVDKPAGGPERRTAIRWTPMEISAVAVPADPDARFRAAGSGRPVEDPMAQQPPPPPADTAPATRAAHFAEFSARARDIEAAGKAVGAPADRVRGLIADASVTVDAARAALIADKVASDAAAPTSAPVARITVGREERDFRRDALIAAIAAKAGSPALQSMSADAQAEGRRMSRVTMAQLIRQALSAEMSGADRADLAYRSDLEVARLALSARAQSSSDFPFVLGAVVEKSLLGSYAQLPKDYARIAKGATISNLRTRYPTIMSGAYDLEQVAEGADYPHRPLLESRESYNLSKYGQIIGLTVEAVLKDDMGAFAAIPAAMAAAAVRNENAIVFSLLGANAAMADSVALFHASHGNLIGAGGGAPSASTLAATDQLIRVQEGLNGEKLALAGKVLIVPAALYHAAAQLFSPRYIPTSATGILAGNLAELEVVSHPTLDDTSSAAWYLCADPMVAPALEYATPSDAPALQVAERENFENDTKQWKVTHWFGAKAIDWRAIAKNPGA